jgi:Family of unknown function (DUF6152)
MHSRVLDRDTAPNENFVLVLTNPYSGPRRAARAKERLANQPRLSPSLGPKGYQGRSPWLVLAVIVGLLQLSISSLAHHGAASLYDVSKETTLKVTITEFMWTNPHVEVGIASLEDKSARWLLELGSPPNIANRGWTSKSLKVGDVVTVTFNPGLRGARIGRLLKVMLPDGKELRA